MKKIVLILSLVGVLISGAFGVDVSLKVTNDVKNMINGITNNDF